VSIRVTTKLVLKIDFFFDFSTCSAATLGRRWTIGLLEGHGTSIELFHDFKTSPSANDLVAVGFPFHNEYSVLNSGLR
jgi:hypothetical protein